MARITGVEATQRWDAALRARGWQRSKLALVMFDYCTDVHGPTRYHPAPAWPEIVGVDGTADLDEYERLQDQLLQQGDPHSKRGAAAHGSSVVHELVATPLPVTRTEIVSTVQRVMSIVHPLAVTQEQILRAAFIAQLPPELGNSIGTASSAIHPERPTPSDNYQYSGNRESGMRARYDLGFGHPTKSADIVGVCELKAAAATYDRLDALSRLTEEQDDYGDAGESAVKVAQPQKREEPLRIDLFKLLDPKLPEQSFRISWIALGRRGRSTAGEICQCAVRIVEVVARDRGLSRGTYAVDPATGWLVFTWTHARRARLELAWYQPKTDNPSVYEPVFRAVS